MDFKVEICIIPKASDLTKFRVSGNLPVLHASISDAKYKNLMKLIDVAIPKFENNEPNKQITEGREAPSNLKPTSAAKPTEDALGRPRSKSFQFAAQEHELVVEEDAGDDKDESFQDAPEAKSKKDINLHQRNFEFKFTVDKLQGSLYRSDPEGKKADTLLVELVAEHFGLDFYQIDHGLECWACDFGCLVLPAVGHGFRDEGVGGACGFQVGEEGVGVFGLVRVE